MPATARAYQNVEEAIKLLQDLTDAQNLQASNRHYTGRTRVSKLTNVHKKYITGEQKGTATAVALAAAAVERLTPDQIEEIKEIEQKLPDADRAVLKALHRHELIKESKKKGLQHYKET